MHQPTKLRDLYLDLFKLTLTNLNYINSEVGTPFATHKFMNNIIVKILDQFDLNLVYKQKPKLILRKFGKDWPLVAHTMIGVSGLNSLQFCIEKILLEKISGDLLEAGVWRGGASIFMRAVLKAYNVTNRKIWLADSFAGLPRAQKQFPADRNMNLNQIDYLSVSLSEVRNNFRIYGLLDRQVKFLPGWFSETLPKIPVKKLALIRIDADMYGSTWDVLTNLYPKLSRSGFVIIDDYFAVPECHKAVDDFRKQENIFNKLSRVKHHHSVYWQK